MDSISENSSPSEDDDDDSAFMSTVAGLTKDAESLFRSRKFADCVGVLNQLAHHKPDDAKIAHNIAITESFQEGYTDPKKLLGVLGKIEVQLEKLAHASEQNVDVDEGLGSIAVPEGNVSSLHKISPSKNLATVCSDEHDNSVTLFNMAVIWFHLHDHAKSFFILDMLFQNIQPSNKAVALRICLLLFDAALVSQRASRCLDVINYMERVFCVNSLVNQVDNGNISQQHLTEATLSLPSNLSITDVPNSDSASLENSLSRTLSDEVLEDEPVTLFSSLDISDRKLTKSSGLQSSGQVDEYISAVELRPKWHLYKVHLLLLTRNLKAAKREIKMAMNMVRDNEHCYPMALYLKSQLEYAQGNHQKAIKLLMASSNRTEMGSSSICYNNLGCIYFRLGMYHTSNALFSKALSNSSSFRKEKASRLSLFAQDKSLLIVYNCGLQYLACGKPIIAARCFKRASNIFYNRPLLWLRIAECCLMALEKGLLNGVSSASSHRDDVTVHVIGKGKWRGLVLEDGISEDGPNNNIAREDSFMGDDLQPCLSVSLARRSLLNALYLLDSYDLRYLKSGACSTSAAEATEHSESISSNDSNLENRSGGDSKTLSSGVGFDEVNSNGTVKEQKSTGSQNTYLQNSVSDYEDICKKEKQIVRQALLADLAYVELELGNPLEALSVARSLLKVPDCLKIYAFKGNMYAAEALCLLNRPQEAAQHLSIYVSNEKEAKVPYSLEDCEGWRMDKNVDFEESNGGSTGANVQRPDEPEEFMFLKPEEAFGTLCADQAVMFAAEGEFELAHQFVIQALSLLPNNPDVIRTAVYVDLMRGNKQKALVRLRQCNRIRFLRGSSRNSGPSEPMQSQDFREKKISTTSNICSSSQMNF